MGRALLRILQVTLTVVGGLLIVPTAVNVSTGSDVPDWLQPYAGWLWPVAVACVVLVIALEVWDKIWMSRVAISTRRPHDPRNRQLALAQVARYVEGRQRGSLAERVRLALALDERPRAVRQPAHLVQRVSGEEFQLSADLTVGDVFDQMSESMLILGAPGSGKTTQLLDLAAVLVARARASGPAGSAHPQQATVDGAPTIPVVVDLADWSRSRPRGFALFRAAERGPRDFAAWLLASLRERYRIPEAISETWLRENQLTLLLDGLDEVRGADRERCVAEINDLQVRWGVTRLAVCSREADYAPFAGQLSLQGAVVIRPLTREQVTAYFTTVSPRLASIAAALSADEELWELLTTPLMLNIMVLAQGDRTWQALSAESDPAARRQLLFDAYVVEVLARRRAHEVGGPERTLRAIRTLAAASVRLNTGVQVVQLDEVTAEHGLDDSFHDVAQVWLLPPTYAICLIVSVAAMSLQFSAAAGLIVAGIGLLLLIALSFDRVQGPATIANYFVMLGYLIMAASAMGLVLALTWLVEMPRQPSPALVAEAAFGLALGLVGLWYWYTRHRDVLVSLVIAIPYAAVAVTVLLLGAAPAALHGWVVGFSGGFCLIACLRLWAAIPGASPGAPDGHKSAVLRILNTQVVLYMLASIVAPIALADSWAAPFWLPLVGWAVGVGYALLPGVLAGVLLIGSFFRVVMVIAGEPVPWRSTFLRFAVDRSLLTFVDGEYRFIHLLVRDHLAQCDPTRLAPVVLRRRAELTAPVRRVARGNLTPGPSQNRT